MRKPEIYDSISEAVFTQQIIELARWHKWRVMHQRPAMTKKGWRTAIQGHAGFPDLLLLRYKRVIMAELKSATGRVTPEQDDWLTAAVNAGIEIYIWRPRDIEEIERILK